MKKLLVLALVLAVSTIANAGFIMSVSPEGSTMPGVYTINIVADADATIGTYLAIGVVGDGVLSGFAKGAQAPKDGGPMALIPSEYGQGAVWELNDNDPAAGVFVPGVWLTATLTGIAGDVVTAYETDGEGYTQIGESFVVTPEPVTVALLGLGGLFIRRRKIC